MARYPGVSFVRLVSVATVLPSGRLSALIFFCALIILFLRSKVSEADGQMGSEACASEPYRRDWDEARAIYTLLTYKSHFL